MGAVLNVARNALRPGYARIMAKKVQRRLETREQEVATRWSHARATTTSIICRTLDADLWEESERWFADFEPGARDRLARLGLDLGGGGNARLLYFLTRWQQPHAVVETGVAAGWSSAAVLAALDRNGRGVLYSSDFPYFRLPKPERYVGWVVPTELRSRWHLYLRGDEANLPTITEECGPVGLFHFDSDKSRAGRRLAMDLLDPVLEEDATVVMDDIHNNLFFQQYVAERSDWLVLENHVGAFGPRLRAALGADGASIEEPQQGPA